MLHPLATGTGRTLLQPATVQRLTRQEAAAPPGTRFAFVSVWQVVTLPVVGPLHTGQIAAAAVNAAWQAGRLVSGGHRMPLWPGARLPATYDARTRTVQVRWRGASAFLDGIVAALAGVTAGLAASALGVPDTVAVAVGLAVGAAFVASYLIRWLWGTAGGGGSGVGVGALAVGLILGVPLVVVLRRHRPPAEGGE